MSAAITGRTEIGGAAVAITMVDVVVFLPIAFMSGIVGSYLREYGAVVVTATLFSLFVSFTLTPLLAAKWSVLNRSEAPPRWLRALDDRRVDIALLLLAAGMFVVGTVTGWFLLNAIGIFVAALLLLNAFVHRYEAILQLYRTKLLPFALQHGAFVVFVCVALLLNAMTLAAGGGMATIAIDVMLLVVCARGAPHRRIPPQQGRCEGSRTQRRARPVPPVARHDALDDDRHLRHARRARTTDAAVGLGELRLRAGRTDRRDLDDGQLSVRHADRGHQPVRLASWKTRS